MGVKYTVEDKGSRGGGEGGEEGGKEARQRARTGPDHSLLRGAVEPRGRQACGLTFSSLLQDNVESSPSGVKGTT